MAKRRAPTGPRGGGMAELVDAADLKSADGDVVGVQVPLPPSAVQPKQGAWALELALHQRRCPIRHRNNDPGVQAVARDGVGLVKDQGAGFKTWPNQ